tara:strand:+ start:1381 stop:1533 length:153 start_codon:yes stop_codon:yes gene_type:complete
LLDQEVLINPLEEKVEEKKDNEEKEIKFVSEKEQKRRKVWSEYLLTQPSL